jgi:predicted transcriptional regulator
MKENPPLGEQELETLCFVSEHAPITVGEVAKTFGTSHGLARTTVLTVMERLRAKGYLTRKRAEGVYRYTPRIDQRDVLANVVAEFVERSLGGSLSPFVTYLADSGRLSPDQIGQLQAMVEQMEAEEGAR